MTTPGAAIEAESFRILAERADLSHYSRLARMVVARVIHASADLEYASTMVVDDEAVEAGLAALADEAAVVTDVRMTLEGITDVGGEVFLPSALDEAADYLAGPDAVLTRTASGIRAAAKEHPDGAVFVIGCAPTALAELVNLIHAGSVKPALVIGMPVGFVGAADAKQRLRSANVPSISNVGEKGGSAVAAAAMNAIARMVPRD